MNYSPKVDADGNVKILRLTDWTWAIVGRLGSPVLPHSFSAVRVTWILDTAKGYLVPSEFELAVVETHPGGSILSFVKHLKSLADHVAAKKPTSFSVYADITRSVEAQPLVSRVAPMATVVQVVNLAKHEWSLPFVLVGRPLLLSRLQLKVSERQLASALPETDDNPGRWNWGRVKDAMATVNARPPRPESGELPGDEIIEDEVVINLGLAVWFSESDRPSKYKVLPSNKQRRHAQ
jgi:hypothetical protein